MQTMAILPTNEIDDKNNTGASNNFEKELNILRLQF